MAPLRERLRKHKFTDAELDVLIEGVTRQEDGLFGLRGIRLTAREKYEIWFEIAEQVCAASGIQRSIEDVKRRWQDLRRRTKAKVLEARRHVARDCPAPSPCLSAAERKVFDSLNVRTIVKDEERNQAACSLPEDLFLDTNTVSPEQQSAPHVEESSVPSVLSVPDADAPLPVAPSRPEVPIKNEAHYRCLFGGRVETAVQEGPPGNATVINSCPGFRDPLRSPNASWPRRTAPLSSFEQQILRAHREHTAALRDGFRSLARQNRLLYRELCETNRNVARIASRIAERSEGVTDMADELVGIQRRIGESIEATNSLQDRVIDLLAAQQERPVIVLPSGRRDSRPAAPGIGEESTSLLN
ncbi:myb-related transcription factor, partner of profilin-like [Scleropages formosus]|uniref:Myb-related transcription factor, partner of profilin-like n=1 Tax=Scleropages formosus TaxID=113540 RepID=A0A8C9U7K3_SCLFO|nr:myb-related transcription factor, partner of profilin-like [Scleropages formosus]XP_018604887.2 myb-related transcription factor, partner of profilin-like [Scleropages formosus]XP_018604888.2 myb-related transcription factor, partner of profilin-like [Scleropages formosus]